jgi:hypothetical protein
MTTVPGFNIVIQQAGNLAEAVQLAGSQKPDPAQIAALQQAGAIARRSTVQELEEAERLKLDPKREERRRRRADMKDAKKRKKSDDDGNDPDGTGKLLDTIV